MLENEKKEEAVSFEELLNDSMKDNSLGKTVTGKVIEVSSKGEIFVDIGYKADGLITKDEYSYDDNLDPHDEFKPGDTITADVLKKNDGEGNVLLSYKRVKQRDAKQDFEKKVQESTTFEEKISEVNDSGLIVNINGIRIFIPFSLSGIKKSEDSKPKKGDIIRFKVIEYEPKEHKIIGSAKVILDDERKKKQDTFWESAKEGQIYDGTVTSISTYGAFVDLGDVQGLLHVSQMAWGRNVNPRDILSIGQKIKVSIKNLDKENHRMLLSYEDKGPNPWDNIEEKYKLGDIVDATIVKIMPYGAFAEIEPGIEALIHISQICVEKITKPDDKLELNQKVRAKIIVLDLENQKMELSIRRLEESGEEIEKIGEENEDDKRED